MQENDSSIAGSLKRLLSSIVGGKSDGKIDTTRITLSGLSSAVPGISSFADYFSSLSPKSFDSKSRINEMFSQKKDLADQATAMFPGKSKDEISDKLASVFKEIEKSNDDRTTEFYNTFGKFYEAYQKTLSKENDRKESEIAAGKSDTDFLKSIEKNTSYTVKILQNMESSGFGAGVEKKGTAYDTSAFDKDKLAEAIKKKPEEEKEKEEPKAERPKPEPKKTFFQDVKHRFASGVASAWAQGDFRADNALPTMVEAGKSALGGAILGKLKSAFAPDESKKAQSVLDEVKATQALKPSDTPLLENKKTVLPDVDETSRVQVMPKVFGTGVALNKVEPVGRESLLSKAKRNVEDVQIKRETPRPGNHLLLPPPQQVPALLQKPVKQTTVEETPEPKKPEPEQTPGITDNLLKTGKSVLPWLLRGAGPAAAVIGAGALGYGVGTLANEKFGISNGIVDRLSSPWENAAKSADDAKMAEINKRGRERFLEKQKQDAMALEAAQTSQSTNIESATETKSEVTSKVEAEKLATQNSKPIVIDNSKSIVTSGGSSEQKHLPKNIRNTDSTFERVQMQNYWSRSK